jgi:hypothetical protein
MKLFEKEVEYNPVNFWVLFFGFSLSAGLFFSFPYQLQIQRWIIIGTGVFYFLWGLWHHGQKGNLCVKTALEYLLFAILGTSIILSTVLRG